MPLCAGPLHTVDDSMDPDFVDSIGGSLYNGYERPECNIKIVRVVNGSSVAPTFSIYTDVPIPARFHGIIINDLNLSADPRSIVFGEAAPAPFMPVNVYDELGHRKFTRFERLQRVLRAVGPVDRHLQLPAAGRSLPERLPTRRQ